MDLASIQAAATTTPSAQNANTARIERTAQEFEALAIAQFLAPLMSSVETPGLAGGGPGEKAFTSLLQEEYAKAIAARGGFGIADQVKASLIDMQSARDAQPIAQGDQQ